MNNIFLLNDSITNGFSTGYLDLLYITAIILAVKTIMSVNPIVSILFLIALFVNMASLLIFVGYNFIGLSYLLVYVGAIAILFLFIIMLINIRISEITHNTWKDLPLAAIVGGIFVTTIGNAVPVGIAEHTIFTDIVRTFRNKTINLENGSLDIMDLKHQIGFASSNGWDNSLVEATHIAAIGNVMYTQYAMWVIVSSMIILTGMVGAIVITVKPKQ